jgi:class 3 adenylate cyclase
MSDSEFEATVFVSAVNGFTERSTKMAPAKIASWTNELHQKVTDAVLERGGVPVKYLGDGFLAYFTGADHFVRAVQSALNARDAVGELVVGLSSGPIYEARIGHPSHARMDILGATVNRAFRIHDWARGNAQSRIAAADVARGIGEQFRLGPSKPIAVKGFPTPLDVCEIIGVNEA